MFHSVFICEPAEGNVELNREVQESLENKLETPDIKLLGGLRDDEHEEKKIIVKQEVVLPEEKDQEIQHEQPSSQVASDMKMEVNGIKLEKEESPDNEIRIKEELKVEDKNTHSGVVKDLVPNAFEEVLRRKCYIKIKKEDIVDDKFFRDSLLNESSVLKTCVTEKEEITLNNNISKDQYKTESDNICETSISGSNDQNINEPVIDLSVDNSSDNNIDDDSNSGSNDQNINEPVIDLSVDNSSDNNIDDDMDSGSDWEDEYFQKTGVSLKLKTSKLCRENNINTLKNKSLPFKTAVVQQSTTNVNCKNRPILPKKQNTAVVEAPKFVVTLPTDFLGRNQLINNFQIISNPTINCNNMAFENRIVLPNNLNTTINEAPIGFVGIGQPINNFPTTFKPQPTPPTLIQNNPLFKINLKSNGQTNLYFTLFTCVLCDMEMISDSAINEHLEKVHGINTHVKKGFLIPETNKATQLDVAIISGGIASNDSPLSSKNTNPKLVIIDKSSPKVDMVSSKLEKNIVNNNKIHQIAPSNNKRNVEMIGGRPKVDVASSKLETNVVNNNEIHQIPPSNNNKRNVEMIADRPKVDVASSELEKNIVNNKEIRQIPPSDINKRNLEMIRDRPKIDDSSCKLPKLRKILPKKTLKKDILSKKDDLNSSEEDEPESLIDQFTYCGVLNSKLVCKKCQKVFGSQDQYSNHINNTSCNDNYEKMKKFVCEICGKAFPRMGKLEEHMNTHTNAKPIKCPLCDKGFNNNGSLNFHKKRVHEKLSDFLKKYICCYCGITSTSQKHILAHEETHRLPQGEEIPKPFKCFECGKGFISRYQKTRHLKQHRLRKCSQCTEHFKTETQLRNHLSAVHKISKEFKCNLCEKTFKDIGTLRGHKKFHTNILSFFCDICDKGFKIKGHLKQHMITHSDERPIVCPECGETFKRITHLKQHEASKHGKNGRKVKSKDKK